MLRNGAVDSENDRLRLGREIRFANRPFHSLDADFGTIHYLGHNVLLT
jgi:hypothetical protein